MSFIVASEVCSLRSSPWDLNTVTRSPSQSSSPSSCALGSPSRTSRSLTLSLRPDLARSPRYASRGFGSLQALSRSRSSVRLASPHAGLPHPLAGACACRSSFRPGLAWAPIPSEVSPHPRYRTLSGRVVLRAVSHLAMPRLRGFQPPLRRAPIFRRGRPPRPGGCVLPTHRCSRLAEVAPLLVVSPLRGDHPGLAPCFQ